MKKIVRGSCRAMVAVSCLAIAVSGPAHAQETDRDLYDGTWSVRVHGVAAGFQSARLVVSNYGGSWRDTSGKAARIDKACRGKSFPVTVQRSTASSFEFTVWGTSVSPACPELTVSIKPSEGKTLHGSVDPAGTIRLERR